MLILNYGNKVNFFPRPFGFFKKWTKKCPKLKSQKYFWERKSLKYNKSPKLLKDSEYN